MNVILVKHAQPLIERAVPPSRWHLSEDGRKSCRPLAAVLRPFAPKGFFTSPQPKALETATLVSGHFGTTPEVRDGLREHDETGAPFFEREADFAGAVEAFFARPDERVFGAESAREALDRFAAEVDALRVASPAPIAIVSHGRVISLYVASRARLRALEIWRQLTLPSFVVLDPEHGRVEHISAPV